jgi:outer membrane protein
MQDENVMIPEEPREKSENLSDVNWEPIQEKIEPKAKTQIFTLQNILLFVLLAGMVVLYILHFNSKTAEEPKAAMALQKSGTKALTVVYVNIDTLNEKYEFVKVLRKDLEGTGKRLQTEVLSEQAAFEKEAADFQKQVAANTIPEEKAKTIYEELMQKQQALLNKKDKYTQQVAEMELNMNIRLLDTITNFLKRYNKIYKFDYILTHKTAGDILIANDTLDITHDVVKSLNKEYEEQKK